MLYKDTNQIKKNYFLNLFSTNAEKRKYPISNNNYIYEWNIRDLQLEKYAEIALIQIANNKADYTEERQYPPKAYNSSTTEILTSNDIFNIAPVPYYKQTITLNTTGITYGSGTYELYSSSVYNNPANQTLYRKRDLFDYNIFDVGAIWGSSYSPTTYLYNGTTNYIENGYYGDWIIIKLTTPIILSRFRFLIALGNNFFIIYAPSLWRCYGSNDGLTWVEIKEASNDVSTNALTTANYLANYFYEKTLTNFNTPYLYFGFTFRKTIGADAIAISELQIFGREPLTRIKQRLTEERAYPPKLYNSSVNEITTTGELSNILPTTFYKQKITLNTTGISYGSGDYILYSSSSYGDPYGSYQKRDLFNYNIYDVGGAFILENYSPLNGIYIGSPSYIKSGFEGEWIIVKLPNSIILTKFRFYARNNYKHIAPGIWKCYGSNDGITFTEITQASNDTIRLTETSYPDNIYDQSLPTFNTPYLYIGFTIQRIVGNASFLNFAEIRLYGKEEIKYLTEEREYPPKLYNSSTTETTTTEVLNKSSFTQKLIVNTDGINYGNGVYNLYYSSIYNAPNLEKKLLFNYITNDFGAVFQASPILYTAMDGYYTGNNFIVNGYRGDWFVIKLITPIILSRFRFYATIDPNFELRVRSPGLWRCYGSNDGINFTEIVEASNETTSVPISTYSTFYEKTLTTFNIPYLYIGWTINKLVGGNTYANILQFAELQIFGKEIQPEDNTYIIRTHNCYNDGWDSQNTTNATLLISNELTSPKNPTYHKLNTNHLNRITLEVSDDIEKNNRNGWDNNIEFGAIFHIRNFKDT